ncbi:MAG: hypothetical protein Tsb0034_19910 [Ekhidna sp.]
MTAEGQHEHFLEGILKSSFYGIMAFKSIRDAKNEITDFEWTFANDIACDVVEIPAEKLIGSRLLELLPGNKETGLFDKYKKVVETGRIATFEEHYAVDGIDKWFRISAVKVGDGFTVTFQDVSDLKEAIRETEVQERKYRMLFEESLDAIFLTNEQFVFMETNVAFQRLFSFEKDELICMSLEGMFENSDDFDFFQKLFLEQGSVEEFETTLLDSEKRRRHCLINCARLHDSEAGQKSFLGVVRDLTKRKKAERELVIAEKLSMTGKISRTIAHEVRNPLTNLTLALEQLKDELPEEVEDTQLYFDIIKRNADRIGKLITDLLDSSKPKELELKKQFLNPVVEGAVDLVRDRLNLRGMELQEDYCEMENELLLDADQLKVALLNLMINAIEAMEEDAGVLSVKTYKDDLDQVIEIGDNGKGIPKEDLKKLFEPFFTSKDEGTGLGLVSVQNIVQSHGGEIEAESEPGKGTTFKVRLSR